VLSTAGQDPRRQVNDTKDSVGVSHPFSVTLCSEAGANARSARPGRGAHGWGGRRGWGGQKRSERRYEAERFAVEREPAGFAAGSTASSRSTSQLW
jgi:hypothetical protein